MEYMPYVTKMNRVDGVEVDPAHTAIMFDQIESPPDSVQYTFMVVVYDNESAKPVYFITSEVNTMAETMGGGSHFLGEFDQQGRSNHGSSDEWGDPKVFFPHALSIVAKKFNVVFDA